jgi:hypothetical protein
MTNATVGHMPRRALATTAAALAAVILAPAAVSAGPTSSLCRAAGRPSSSAEIMGRAEAALARVQMELPVLQIDYDAASTASPAAWRLREELDRLDAESRSLRDVDNTAFVRGDATPGTPAQFRAQEELDGLCASVGDYTK